MGVFQFSRCRSPSFLFAVPFLFSFPIFRFPFPFPVTVCPLLGPACCTTNRFSSADFLPDQYADIPLSVCCQLTILACIEYKRNRYYVALSITEALTKGNSELLTDLWMKRLDWCTVTYHVKSGHELSWNPNLCTTTTGISFVFFWICLLNTCFCSFEGQWSSLQMSLS